MKDQSIEARSDEVKEMLVRVDKIAGIGLHLDLALRQIQEAYLNCFKALGLDITIEQWVIIHKIAQYKDGIAQAEIAKSNFRNRATTSRILSVLQRKKLLNKTRFPGDKKRYKLELTNLGWLIYHKAMPHTAQLRRRAIEGISMAELDTFISVLEKIKANYL